jgi:hypothetical protein
VNFSATGGTAAPAGDDTYYYTVAYPHDRVDFGTTQFAFESDNHAFASVPEPASLGLLGLGLLGASVARRRKKQ